MKKAKPKDKLKLNEVYVKKLCLLMYLDQLEQSCKGDADFAKRRLTKELGSEEAAMERLQERSMFHKKVVVDVLKSLDKRGLLPEGARA